MKMIYQYKYQTPTGFDDILLESDGYYLTGLRFMQEEKKVDNDDLLIFKKVISYLDSYFKNTNSYFSLQYLIDVEISIKQLTCFQQEVLTMIKEIPFGKTITYKEVAQKLALKKHMKQMSAQAVGHALSVNPILLIIPCHRVIGSKNNLVGYAGGIKNKEALLKYEKSIN